MKHKQRLHKLLFFLCKYNLMFYKGILVCYNIIQKCNVTFLSYAL